MNQKFRFNLGLKLTFNQLKMAYHFVHDRNELNVN